ncbi:MAG: MiaB/RimO family radical SAM methylthiotransferase [bacterium]
MKTYHIITIGCQMNESDSERIAGALEKQGYKKSEDKYSADLAVINTCGVRQSAEDRIYGLIPGIKKANPKTKIMLTGCLACRKDVRRRLKKHVDLWMTIGQITNSKGADYFKAKPKYESEFSAFAPIGNGCNNFCSYCVVPYARGREVWRPAKDALAEVKSLVKKNYKEIVFIAQNVNSYKDGKTDFADLLKMANNVKGEFWIRFYTSHPKDMSAKLIKTISECEKVCRHIHLPAQSGDDAVLKRMNRKYTHDDYVKLVGKIRKQLNRDISRLPVSITTDIIVGFPGETKKQFGNTAKLMKKIKFDMAYISQYSPRPGTAAMKMADNVSKPEKKRREEELNKILKRAVSGNNKKYAGKTVKVLAEGKGKNNNWIGRTETAKKVKFFAADGKKDLTGKFVDVKINKVMDFGLEG